MAFISVSNILRLLDTSTKIDFSITACRFVKYIFLVSQTILAIVKAIRLFSAEDKFYVCMHVCKSARNSHWQVLCRIVVVKNRLYIHKKNAIGCYFYKVIIQRPL